MMPPAQLDHVSVAVPAAAPAWPLLRGRLGGEWTIGGTTPAFRFGILRYANGMCLELLEPRGGEADFVDRFLDRGGPGMHHLTFKVPDLLAATDAAAAAGYPSFGVNTDNPAWQEAFVHPRVTGGTLVQLACSQSPAGLPPPPADLPPAGPTRAALRVVEWTATDPGRAVALLRLLGGRVTGAATSGIAEVTFRDTRIRVRDPRAGTAPARLEFDGVDPVTRVSYAGHGGVPFRDPTLGVDIVLC